MSGLDPKEKYGRAGRVLAEGLDGIQGRVKAHNSDETLRHFLIKSTIAHILQEAGRSWETEAELQGDRGVVDVLDLGPSDGKAMVYEVETSYSPQRARDKLDQYQRDHNPLIRDVIVIPAKEAPTDIHELREWLLEEYIIGVDVEP